MIQLNVHNKYRTCYRLPFLPLLDAFLASAALPLPLLTDRIAFLTLSTSPPDDSDDFFDFLVAGSFPIFERMARFCDCSCDAEISVGSN